MEGIITSYTGLTQVLVKIDQDCAEIQIGEYAFSQQGFHALLGYLWAGGYPRWKDSVRPSYILKMREAVERSANPLLHNITVFD